MIIITESAQTQLAKLLAENGKPGIRLAVKGGGCSGLMTDLNFDEPKADDKVVDFTGGKVFIDPKSYLYVMDSVIDFSGGLNGKGFSVEVVGAQKSCGCGSSFSY